MIVDCDTGKWHQVKTIVNKTVAKCQNVCQRNVNYCQFDIITLSSKFVCQAYKLSCLFSVV